MTNPRENADDAYACFMSMGESEWQGCLRSIIGGGVLEPQEQLGFERALKDRLDPPCTWCHHQSPHTGGGLGVCLHPDCGCDGPPNALRSPDATPYWYEHAFMKVWMALSAVIDPDCDDNEDTERAKEVLQKYPYFGPT